LCRGELRRLRREGAAAADPRAQAGSEGCRGAGEPARSLSSRPRHVAPPLLGRTAMITRRGIVAGAALLGVAGHARGAPVRPAIGSRSVLAYVGSYTDASKPAGHGQGITLLH